MGGRGFADVDKGTTTTVPLALFRALIVRITAGRHFRLSIPSDGSELTSHTSPRLIAVPSGLFLTANAVSYQSFPPLAHFRIQSGIPLNLKGKKIQRIVVFGQRLFDQLRHKSASLPGGTAFLNRVARESGI